MGSVFSAYILEVLMAGLARSFCEWETVNFGAMNVLCVSSRAQPRAFRTVTSSQQLALLKHTLHHQGRKNTCKIFNSFNYAT